MLVASLAENLVVVLVVWMALLLAQYSAALLLDKWLEGA